MIIICLIVISIGILVIYNIYRQNKIIVAVGITTTHNRIPYIVPTLKSLLDQTFIPKTIVLSIPYVMARTGEQVEIPQSVIELARESGGILKIHRTHDFGPATKFVGLMEVVTDPDTYLVWCDDDIIYHPDFLNTLVKNTRKLGPTCAAGFSGAMLDENGLRFVNEQCKVNVLEGWLGVCCQKRNMPSHEIFYSVTPEKYKTMSEHQLLRFRSDDYVICKLLREKGVYLYKLSNSPMCAQVDRPDALSSQQNHNEAYRTLFLLDR